MKIIPKSKNRFEVVSKIDSDAVGFLEIDAKIFEGLSNGSLCFNDQLTEVVLSKPEQTITCNSENEIAEIIDQIKKQKEIFLINIPSIDDVNYSQQILKRENAKKEIIRLKKLLLDVCLS